MLITPTVDKDMFLEQNNIKILNNVFGAICDNI